MRINTSLPGFSCLAVSILLVAGCTSPSKRTYVSSDRDPDEIARENEARGLACGVDMAIHLAAWLVSCSH